MKENITEVKRAVLYARVSGDDTGKDGRNLDGQLEMCRKYAEERGWKIGIAPSGAMAGTVGAHVSRPGVGWGNIKYQTQGDQVVGLKVVLPNGQIVQTGSAASPSASSFCRYALGPAARGSHGGWTAGETRPGEAVGASRGRRGPPGHFFIESKNSLLVLVILSLS